ncbi:hypothetical protein CEXT_68211 [Caerostris extrusa]|uniref:Uncharacterized protein n=1 Tax=Caerostris extrusa TaxID=172846 RepID=A0AAV4W3K5_CAEEX|nr:hypothetical protein CEXT_68211 [Caerostris extrusa]
MHLLCSYGCLIYMAHPDRLGMKVPGVPELRAPGPGDEKLSGGEAPPHQDRRLRHEQGPLRRRLLQDTGAIVPKGQFPLVNATIKGCIWGELDLK